MTSIALNCKSWLDFIAGKPDASIFHHPVWIEFLVRCYGYTPHLLTIINEGQQIQGGVPLLEVNSWLTGRRVVGLPFSDFCPPVVANEAAMGELILAVQKLSSQEKWRKVQIRSEIPTGPGIYDGESFFLHTTALTPDSEQVYKSFKKSNVQRHIGQAEKFGVTIRLGKTRPDMELFYELHLKSRRRLGVPVQPKRFFQLLWEQVILCGFGFVLLAYSEDQLLAGAVFLYYNEQITYKFGASNPDFWKLRPNHLLFWHAIRWGCENGFKVFDWGRTDLDNKGLRDFKSGWGSEERLVHYSIIADHPPSHKLSGTFQKHIMKRFIQVAPLWVCRLIGELFYVHTA